MNRAARIARVFGLGGTLAVALSGCVAALIPLAASSTMVRKQMAAKQAERTPVPAPGPAAASTPAATVASSAARPVAAAVPAGTVPPGMQYLYGSGEAAGASVQAYHGLVAYLESISYRRPQAMRQVIITDGASLAQPYFEPCGKKPPAVVLDVDETALLNLGYEANDAARALPYDQQRWERWETTGAARVPAVPGAKAALDRARALNITVIFNSNRSAANAAASEAALNGAGLGPVKHGETLWLRGDDGGGSGKDDRRWAIATGYCVVALVGDQLGDFSDLFNDPALSPAQRRAAAQSPKLAELWGNGWFMLPNPVYGSALKGGFDDVFPADKRWTDPGPTGVK